MRENCGGGCDTGREEAVELEDEEAARYGA